VIDELVDRFSISGPIRFGKSMIGKGTIAGQKVILMKPLTYMNLSGEAIREVVSYYKVDPHSHLIVISDDIDLPVGHLRIRKKGSAGGHNGLKNIIQHLGDNEFTRIRIGVGGKPDPSADLANHVLGHFTGKDRATMEEAYKKAADAIECALKEGPDKAMNLFNTKKEKKKNVNTNSPTEGVGELQSHS
jgi:PTH1 family peptidyl-tRNA hydrolase